MTRRNRNRTRGTSAAGAPALQKLFVVAAIIIIAIIAAAIFFWRRHSTAAASSITAAKRDVILVTLDTVRADALGFAGNTRVRTPFLDALAARGIAFTNAHAHNVITLPSHVNIITGLYPFQHGVRENAGYTLDAKTPTIATMLRPLGYTTGAFIAAFPLDARFGLNQGFDTYDDNYGKGQATVDFVLQERRADAVLTSATEWWRSHEGRKRFLWVHLYDAHAPYHPPEPFLSEFRGNEYLGEVSYVDSQLQAFIAPILTADPDALIVVTADHGEALGDHGESTHGLFAYESTLKIPLIIAGAGLPQRVESGYVRHVDIVPTILQAVGAPARRGLPGTSLVGAIGSRDSYFESLSASLNRGWAPLTGIIHSGLKYIDLPLAELYDLPRDPRERQNLRDERRREVEQARQLLAPTRAAASARTVDPDTVAKLRSLGYISSASTTEKKSYTAADDPKNLVALDNRMHDAVDAFERHQPERALQLARAVVAERPDMLAGRELLAFMLQENDRIAEAMEQLKVIAANPSADDGSRTQLALLFCETGRPEQAVALLQPFAATSKDPDVLNAFGVALMDTGRAADSEHEFQHILSIDPNNAPALQNLGISALRQGQIDTAQQYLTRALALNARLPIALNTLGVVYAQRNQYEPAVEKWKQAVAIDPRQYDALFNIGLVEGHLGHRDSARAALEQFIRTAPQSQYRRDIDKARAAVATLR